MSERRVYPSLDIALREFPWWPEANLQVIREKVAGLPIREIYTPPKRSYIGVVLENAPFIVSLHFGFIAGLRDENGKKFWIELPVNRIHDGGYGQSRSDGTDPCPNCGILLPVSGLCDDCY